ncbi:hypothetical protein C8R46DRAFT_371005 [Mycena filopes]|nr:hypothetical protein C8R46DRAFT_371005 [Mycena filopes]
MTPHRRRTRRGKGPARLSSSPPSSRVRPKPLRLQFSRRAIPMLCSLTDLSNQTPEAGSSSQSSPEMTEGGVPDVDGNARKRRRIHLVLVPEREIKEEEELFDSIVDYPSSPPAEANACVSTPPPRSSSRPSAQETQQPTPPASHRSDTPFLPPTTGRGQQQPTPPLCPTAPAPELLPTLTLSWPAEIVDAETYALAAASTQALIDHYLQNVARLVGFDNRNEPVQSAILGE